MEPEIVISQPDGHRGHSVFDPPLAAIKRCERCGSVFVDDFECQACGHQLRPGWIGRPLGDSGFYALQEQYRQQLAAQRWRLWRQGRHALQRDYRRHLLRRFDHLYCYLEGRDLSGEEQNTLSLFWLELKDLVRAMVNNGIEAAKIRRLIDHSTDQLLQQSVLNWLYADEEREVKFSLLDFLLDYRLFGLIRLNFLLLFFLCLLLLSSLSIAFFPSSLTL